MFAVTSCAGEPNLGSTGHDTGLEPTMSLGRSCLLSDKCLHRLNKQDRIYETKFPQKLLVWFCDLLIAPAEPSPVFSPNERCQTAAGSWYTFTGKKWSENVFRLTECRTCPLWNTKWRAQPCTILFFSSCSYNVWSQYASLFIPASAWSAVGPQMQKPSGGGTAANILTWSHECCRLVTHFDMSSWLHVVENKCHRLPEAQTKRNNLKIQIQNNLVKILFHGFFFWLTHNRFIQIYKYNFRFCWPSFKTGQLSAWSYTTRQFVTGWLVFVTRTVRPCCC